MVINGLYSVEDSHIDCNSCASHQTEENQNYFCGCESNSCDTDSHSSCCSDSFKYVRLADNQLVSEFGKISPQSMDIFQAFENLNFDLSEGFISTADTELILYNYPPPFLYFQQLRFCA